MILVDFSSISHRKIFTSVKQANPSVKDGKFVTSEFITLTKFQILEELFKISNEFSGTYGEMVICLDNKSPEGYWRKDVYPLYKSGRSKIREESEIDFSEIFPDIKIMTDVLREHSPWRVLDVPRAEADDIILVLAEEFKRDVLIHSPDKDMIQAQRGTSNVKQYSSLTRKWIEADTKSDNMDDWITEHIVLGDVADEVPKVVDGTEFSDNFIKYLQDNNISALSPYEFKNSDLTIEEKTKLVREYDVYCTNKKGEQTNLDIYKKIRFGPSTLNKEIDKHGSLEEWLDSHPLYKEHYDRNFILVMREGIPDYIKEGTIDAYAKAETKYNSLEFEKYLKDNRLHSLLMELPQELKHAGELTIDDFDW